MFSGPMPDITPAQIVAVLGNVIAVAVAFGLHLTTQQEDVILALAGAIGSFLIIGDARLRGNRALAHAAIDAATVTNATPDPTVPEFVPAEQPAPDVAPAAPEVPAPQPPGFLSTLLGQ